MRIALDHLPAVTHAPGVGRYARELARALAARKDCPELVLSEVGPGERSQVHRLRGLDRCTRVSRVTRERWLQLRQRLLGRGVEAALPAVDLFHRTRPLLPALGPVPMTLPIADLPAPGSPAEDALRRAAQSAHGVVVFAERLRPVLADRLGLEEARVHWTPVGCEHFERERQTAPAPLEGPPTILVLGAVREARRPEVALAALERLSRSLPEARLRLFGREGDCAHSFRERLARSPIRNAVEWHAGEVEDDLPGALATADVLLHLAEAESSPVTPLEALAAGAAVVAERLPAFEEALGSHALWTDPDPAEIATRLEAALSTSREQEARTARRAHAATFTWDRCAQATLAAWRSALAAGPPR